MEFQVLGPVAATVGDHQVDMGPPRQRCVLAVLLVEAGSVVPAEQLIDRVWGTRRRVRPAAPCTAM
ncbi:AfsR/SARP family transcriptional regulator [Phytohabitans rumicis]|uniref:OmpR/PhoB-type domain-containing protein n=1 Tax=Phytohabitans rumicis TaxID=1076125 RepID=A0A6V8KVR1_9ACTN|nr:hypothetical protein [Phytohabitans rumicis]GFJ87480.1 hypothetical protein Prum_011220 [Phytohabitans rumicis]